MRDSQDKESKSEHTTEQDAELTLDEIFRGYDDELDVEEYDWGEPIGNEFW